MHGKNLNGSGIGTFTLYAYRILKEDTKTYIQDCEDDGEIHAGSRLLHLLQVVMETSGFFNLCIRLFCLLSNLLFADT